MIVPVDCRFPHKGTLALAGSGEYLPPMEPVDRVLLAELGEPGRVVCLPTAAGTEGQDRLDYWMQLGEKHFKKLEVESVESLPVFTREHAFSVELVKKVEQANFVYLSGGKPSYLLECFTATPILETILRKLDTGGVVAGCSAGAMIFGERIPNRSFIGGTTTGLNLLPNHFVVPHFDEIPFILKFGIPQMVGHLTLLGIEANTVLHCRDNRFSVIGEGGITLGSGSNAIRYLAG